MLPKYSIMQRVRVLEGGAIGRVRGFTRCGNVIWYGLSLDGRAGLYQYPEGEIRAA